MIAGSTLKAGRVEALGFDVMVTTIVIRAIIMNELAEHWCFASAKDGKGNGKNAYQWSGQGSTAREAEPQQGSSL